MGILRMVLASSRVRRLASAVAAHAGCQRVAGVEGHVLHRPALDALVRTPAALRIGVALRVAVVGRIGIDDAADRPVLLGELGFEAAPALAVAGDDDLALHIHAHALERLVVVGHAVVDVDELARDVAVALVGDIGRQHPGGLGRGGVAGDRRLGQPGLIGRLARLEQVERLAYGGGVEDLERLDVSVPAPGLELLQDPLGVRLVVWGAHFVRLGRKAAQPLADLGGGQLAVESRLQRTLGVGGPRGEAQQRRRGLGIRGLGAGVAAEERGRGQQDREQARFRYGTRIHGGNPLGNAEI